MNIIHKTGSDLDQGQSFTRVVVEARPNGSLVRYTIDVDSHYPHQSHIHADLWTAAGWVEMVRILGSDPMVATGRNASARISALDRLTAILVKAVDAFLTD